MAHARPLRHHLARLFLAAVLPLLALAGLLIFQVVNSERDTRLQSMRDLAGTLSSAIDAEVNRSLLAMQMLATSEAIDRLDLAELRTDFENARSLHGRWSSMSFSRADGVRLFNLRIPADQPIPAAPAHTAGLDAAIRAGSVYVSDVVLSSTSGKPTVFFGVPVVRRGAPAYGIAATMEFDVWTQWLKQRIPLDTIAAIDDRSGVIFARSERPENFVGRPATEQLRKAYAEAPSGVVRNVNREGVDIYVAYTTSQLTGWHTLIIMPASVVDAGPQRYALGFAGMTLVVLLLTFTAAWLLSRPLAMGIDRLRRSIGQVGSGERPMPPSSRISELNEAEQAASHAADRLFAARDDLVRQREELRTMLDLLPVGVAVAHDPRALRVTYSPAFHAMLGRPPDEAGMHGSDEVSRVRYLRNQTELAAEDLPLQRAAREGIELRDQELDIELRDGHQLHLLVNAAPLFDPTGSVRGAIAAHIDITALKRVQQALQLADRQKNEFLTTLAHELRNPIAPIRYAVELLRPEAGPAVIERVRGILHRQTTHIARLLDDLLDLSRITRNVIELQRDRVDLQSIVHAAVDNAGPSAEAAGLSIEFEPTGHALWVDGDSARLLQILDNLLSNACKYTPRGGHISVSTELDGDHGVVRVVDDGIGLSPEMMPRLFSLFGQVHRERGNATGGLGIGLAVVRKLVELHGGTVVADSKGMGRGAVFAVRLPLVTPPLSTGSGGEAGTSIGFLALDVLVVDDNVDGAESLADVLRHDGARVKTAHSSQAALELLSSWKPRVALLDIGLPDGSGNDLARYLRGQPWGADMLLVAVTGWGQDADRSLTAMAGFDVHFVKPIDPQRIRDAIATFAARGHPAGPREAAAEAVTKL